MQPSIDFRQCGKEIIISAIMILMGEATVEIPVPNKKELAQRNYGYALEVALGGIMEPVEAPENYTFKPFVNYRQEASEKEKQAADLAIKDLFRAAAEREKLATAAEMQTTTPYSNKALVLEKPGPYEIASDYVLGLRKGEEAQAIASGVWAEFVKEAETKRSEFIKLKTDHLKASRTNKRDPEWDHVNWLQEGQYHQAERADAFMQRAYKLKPYEFEHTQAVDKLKQTRANPIPEQNLRTQLGF